MEFDAHPGVGEIEYRVPPTAHLGIRVVDAKDGTELETFTLSLRRENDWGEWEARKSADARTDDGYHRMRVRTGRVDVRIGGPDHRIHIVRGVEVLPDGTSRLEVQLERTAPPPRR